MELVGIGGYKQAGKDTSAQLLVDKYGFKLMSLAVPIRMLVSKVLDIPIENTVDATKKEVPFAEPITLEAKLLDQILEAASDYHEFTESQAEHICEAGFLKKLLTPRHALQFIGTDLLRTHADQNFWVKALEKEMKAYDRVVIPDVRFSNERIFIRQHQGVLLRVERPDRPPADGHVSENSLGGAWEYDYIIINDSTIEKLHQRVDAVYNIEKVLREDGVVIV